MSRLLRCSRGHLFSDHLAGCDQCALVAPLAASAPPPVASGVPASLTSPVSAPVTESAPPRKKRRGLVLLFGLIALFALAFVATRVLGPRPAAEDSVVAYQAPAAVATRAEPPPSPQLLSEPTPKEETPPMGSEEFTIEPIVPEYIPPTGERDPVVSLRICEDSGKLANSDCPHVMRRRFRLLDRPTEICTLHSGSFRPAPSAERPTPTAPRPTTVKPPTAKPEVKPPAIRYVQRTVCPDSGLLANRYCPKAEIRRFAQGTEPTVACGLHAAPKPEMVEVRICEDSRFRANPNCPNTSVQSFVRGTEPSGVCTVHVAAPPPVVKVDPPAPKPNPPVSDTKGIQIMVCRDSGERATPYCTNTEPRTFPRGAAPRKCRMHTPRGSTDDTTDIQVCADTGLIPTRYCPHLEFRRFHRADRPKDRCTVHHG